MVRKKKVSFTNKEIAELLDDVAAAYILKKKNRFRIAAYQRASAAIEHLTSEVKDLWDEKKLEEIPGVGKNIASYLDELFRKGKVSHFEKIFKNLPKGMFELMKIPGIGPKRAYKLSKKLKIKNAKQAVTKLKKAIQSGKIEAIEGFGEKSQLDISQSLKEIGRKSKRILLSSAIELSNDLINYMKGCLAVKKIDVLGSLRRRCSTIGDIDIAVATSDHEKVIKYFLEYPKKTKFIEAGEKKASILIYNQYQIDLRVESLESYGALLQHFTGSKQHNIQLREIAIKKDLSLSEYGIKRKTGRIRKFSDEESFYKYLGMDLIPPEIREGTGEIELAQKHKIPSLVKLKDIKGDLQMHTSFDIETSHDLGADSMEKMVQKGEKLGYQYLAFTAHNPSISRHTESQINSILKRRKLQIDKLNYSREKNKKKLFVFNSLEIDIRPNGKLALPTSAFDHLDFGLASIHSSFRMKKDKMTQRILDGLKHPKIKILAHPTGRLLGRRESFEADWEKIFKFCREKNKFVEINAFPDRLDLPDFLVKQAIKIGVKLVISTDSHATSQLDFMPFGVYTARRGWAKKNDIINTLSYNEIRKLLIKGG